MKLKHCTLTLIASLCLLVCIFTVKAQDTELAQGKYRLPYKNTYVKEPLVAENEFRMAKPTFVTPKTFEEAKEILPKPIWEGHEKEIEMYWRAWEIAISNIRAPQEGSGFVSGYLDTAYNGNIFMWDSSFILMFARYGTYFYPFQLTLDNFYAKQHPDGFICREIKADGADCFERYDPVSTGPNIIPWCEMVYYRQFGDVQRLHKIFPVLVAYYKWLKFNRTWQNGTYWSSGWGTGMDNIPRLQSQYNQNFSHGHMTWLDTNLQQIMMADMLLQMGFETERWQEIEEFEDEALMLRKYVKTEMWNEKTGFLYDKYADGSLTETMSIAAFWALHIDALDKKQQDKLVAKLEDKNRFNRLHRVPSIAADHPKYKADGRYWQGGVWPGTNYMVVTGLRKKGYEQLAYDIAKNDYYQLFDIWSRTNTFFEYYSPEKNEPGFMARKDFVGWTGLAPIAGLIEFMLGITADFTQKTITWNMVQTEAHGIERYPFGMDNPVTLKAAKRSSANAVPVLEVETNIPFKLVLKYGKNQVKEIDIPAGKGSY